MNVLQKAAHCLFWGDMKKLAKDESGQVMVITAALALALIIAWGGVFNLGEAVGERMRMQDAADAAAYSGALWGARMMNFLAYTNRTLIAHFVTMSQLVVLHSNSKTLYDLSKLGTWLPYVGWIFKIINTIIGIYEVALRWAGYIAVNVLDSGFGTGLSLNSIILGAQKMMPLMLFAGSLGKLFGVDLGGINSAQQKLVNKFAGDDKIRINPMKVGGDEALLGIAMEALTFYSYWGIPNVETNLIKLPRPFELRTGSKVGKSAFKPSTDQWRRLQSIIRKSYRPRGSGYPHYPNVPHDPSKNFFFHYSKRGNWIPFILEFNLGFIRARWIEQTKIDYKRIFASDAYKVEVLTLFGWVTILYVYDSQKVWNSDRSKFTKPLLGGFGSDTPKAYYRGIHGINNEEYKLVGGIPVLDKLSWIAGIFEINSEKDKDNALVRKYGYNYVITNRKATHYVIAFRDAKDTIIRKVLKLNASDSEYWNMLWPEKHFTIATAEVFYERPGRSKEVANLMNPFWAARLVSVDKSLDELFGKIPFLKDILKHITIIPH